VGHAHPLTRPAVAGRVTAPEPDRAHGSVRPSETAVEGPPTGTPRVADIMARMDGPQADGRVEGGRDGGWAGLDRARAAEGVTRRGLGRAVTYGGSAGPRAGMGPGLDTCDPSPCRKGSSSY
jgi:hypothetical protein